MRIGVLLAGCGLYDGSDIHETVFLLEALEARGERPLVLAPDAPQMRVVDHLSGETMPGEPRGMLRESARLARGAVRALGEVRPEDLEALVLPGGYGPAVNLATGFATPGVVRSLLPEVEAFLRHFIEGGKPVGLIGLGELPVRRLLGQTPEPPAPADPRRVSVDPQYNLMLVAGSAGSTRLQEVRAGIEALVDALLEQLAQAAARPGGVPAESAGSPGSAQ
jgi:enhancing lycopene biosynthesis protein 2